MQRGEINNEQIYLPQFANQIEGQTANLYNSSMGASGNNLQQFNPVNAYNCIPNAILGRQVRNEGLFSPHMMQHPNFQSNIVGEEGQGFYGAVVDGGGIINAGIDQNQCAAMFFHRGNTTDVDLETMLSMDHGNLQGVKRKANEDYSLSYSGAKRRITDEHMAGEMNTLSITNDHNYCGNEAKFNPDDNLYMKFGATPDMQDGGGTVDDVDHRKQKEHLVFQFSAPLEQMLKRENEIDILPHKVIQQICKPCLAVVPWIPPPHIETQIPDEDEAEKEEKLVYTEDAEMEDDNIVA